MQAAAAARAVTAAARVVPGLAGVSETMLWSLHNRACEAKRFDGILVDPDSVSIHDAMDYDFAAHFGRRPTAFGTSR